MPRTTRSAAKASGENACTPKKGTVEEKVKSSRKAKPAGTTTTPKKPTTKEPRNLAGTPSAASPVTEPDKNEHTETVTSVNSAPVEDKIAGARMSGVKHSGLLAKDEEMRSKKDDTLEDDDACMEIDFSILSTPEENTSMLTGKDIYTFKHRSARRNTKTHTPLLSTKNESQNPPEKTRVVTPQPKKRKIGQKSVATAGKKEMETDKQEETVKSKRTTRSRHALPSDSDADSTDLSEDEELALLAAKLSKGAAVGEVNEDTIEDYFTTRSSKAGTTSDHTLAKLACPQMDQQTVKSALSETPSNFEADRQALYTEYKSLYPYWLLQMSNGYNILLYGLGSKRKLLEDFRCEELADTCHMVINGFFPGLTIKQVLTTLSTDLLKHTGTFKSLTEHARFISRVLDCSANGTSLSQKQARRSVDSTQLPSEVFLIVHNIDGPMLRGDTAQTVLSILAQSQCINILASVDHINAPLLWDQKKTSKFNWLYHDVTTFELYSNETSYENSLLVRQAGNLALSSLTHVTKSLTPNARGIFELLVKYQLEHKPSSDGIYLGMSFHEAYVKCREKFLVNSDLTLRAQLTEFIDHKLVRTRKGHDGVEYLYVPVDDSALEEFLEQNTGQATS